MTKEPEGGSEVASASAVDEVASTPISPDSPPPAPESTASGTGALAPEVDALAGRLRRVKAALTEVQSAVVKGLLPSIEAISKAPLEGVPGVRVLESLGLGLEAAMGTEHAAPLLKGVETIAELARRVHLLVDETKPGQAKERDMS